LELKFSEEIGKSIRVEIDNSPTELVVQRFELIINNKVVAAFSEIPKNIPTNALEKEFLPSTHWVKVRLLYNLKGQKITVESPYYKNPWWPYGGYIKN